MKLVTSRNEIDHFLWAEPSKFGLTCQFAAFDRHHEIRFENFICFDQAFEGLAFEEENNRILHCRDGCGSITCCEQGFFAKIIIGDQPGKKLLALLVRPADFYPALKNQVKPVWFGGVLKDHVTSGIFTLFKFNGNTGELAFLQPVKEMDLIQEECTIF